MRVLSPGRVLWVLGGLSALLALALAFGMLTGPTSIDLGTVWSVLSGEEPTGAAADIVRRVRWPRVALAGLVGASLAVAGVLFQALLRNPLADPYILGVSGGAAVAALLAMIAGLAGAWLMGGAMVGSLISVLLVFGH